MKNGGFNTSNPRAPAATGLVPRCGSGTLGRLWGTRGTDIRSLPDIFPKSG